MVYVDTFFIKEIIESKVVVASVKEVKKEKKIVVAIIKPFHDMPLCIHPKLD